MRRNARAQALALAKALAMALVLVLAMFLAHDCTKERQLTIYGDLRSKPERIRLG